MKLFDFDFEGVIATIRGKKKERPKVSRSSSPKVKAISNRIEKQSRKEEKANGFIFREANEAYHSICNSRGFVMFQFLVDCPEPTCGRKAWSQCKDNGICISRNRAFIEKANSDRKWYEEHTRNAYKGGRR